MVMGELPEEAEVVVIGGGPGGYAAAFRASDLGKKVAVVNNEHDLGGVCLLRGCIPSKTLLHLMELVLEARRARDSGIVFEAPKIDLERLREARRGVVDTLTGGLARLCESRGIQLIEGTARFEDADTLRVSAGGDAGSQLLKFRHAIVATGSRPVELPALPFGARVWDSAAALDLERLPRRLLVVGGGYVGLELGMVYAAFGSEVTLVEQAERILPEVDADLVEPLAGSLDDVFASLETSTRLEEAKIEDDRVEAMLANDAGGRPREFDGALVAVGRRPNTEALQLDAAEIDADERGFIPVDEHQRVAGSRRIYAVGDVCGGALLAHEAMYEGKIAAERIAGEPSARDARAVPAVVYTSPQIAWCGLTESEASSRGTEIEVRRFPWKASGRALSVGAGAGMTKLLLEPGTGRVLGVGVVGAGAEDLIAEGVLAVEMGALAEDLSRSIHPHPTLSETLEEAAGLLLGEATHLVAR